LGQAQHLSLTRTILPSIGSLLLSSPFPTTTLQKILESPSRVNQILQENTMKDKPEINNKKYQMNLPAADLINLARDKMDMIKPRSV
jgi:hypothetical protein